MQFSTRLFGALTRLLLLWTVTALTSSAVHAATHYAYDKLGRVIQATEWDGATAQYAYDATGNITSIARVQATSLTGTLATNGTATAVSLSSGQNERLTFTASAGQTVALTISSIATSPASTPIAVYVFAANGTAIQSATTTAGGTLALSNLSAGTYTVVIVANGAASASMQVSANAAALDDVAGDAPTLPEWAAIILGFTLFTMACRNQSSRTRTSRRLSRSDHKQGAHTL